MLRIFGFNQKYASIDAAVAHIKSQGYTTGWTLITNYRSDDGYKIFSADDYAEIRLYLSQNQINPRHGDQYAIMRNKTVMVQTRSADENTPRSPIGGGNPDTTEPAKINTWNGFFERVALTLYSDPALPGGDAGMYPAAHPRETLDTQYDIWLDFLAANQALEDDPMHFEPYVWEVERSEDAYHFWRAMGQLEDAIARWQGGER